MNWQVTLEPYREISTTRWEEMEKIGIHSNPDSNQISAWNTSAFKYTHGQYRVPYDIDGLSVDLFSAQNVLFHPTTLQLAWACIMLADWPLEFDIPDLLDIAAFSAAADYSGCPYLRLYVHLLPRVKL